MSLRASCLAFGLRHGPQAGFRVVPICQARRAGLRPITPTRAYFHQYFHQILKHFYYFHQQFIIFTSIIISNTYIQVTTTSIVNFHRAATRPTVGTGRAVPRAWVAAQAQSGPLGHAVLGPDQIVEPWARPQAAWRCILGRVFLNLLRIW